MLIKAMGLYILDFSYSNTAFIIHVLRHKLEEFYYVLYIQRNRLFD
jgi:hypothetical protein